MSSSERLRRLKIILRQEKPILAGEDGEKAAEKWLISKNWNYCKIEQYRNTLSTALKDAGGKRPDFLAEFDDGKTILALDSKHVATGNLKYFELTNQELEKYKVLQSFLEEDSDDEIFVVFMVIPKEKFLTRMVLVELSEFNKGQPSLIKDEQATRLSLMDREELWFDLPP